MARLVEARSETTTARTLVLEVPGWPGHLAGQHVDVRLTAPDGYTAQRSYSIASAPNGERVELTVQLTPGGEVSTYLTEVFAIGDPVEIRGPVGGWFVWRSSDAAPVFLVAGGSGIAPLMAMIRARAAAACRTRFRLLYSARSPGDVIYAEELRRRARDDRDLDVAYAYTRSAPDGSRGRQGRVDATTVAEHGWPAELEPTCFVCGPTAFVERVADILVAQGHHPGRVKTERFGPTGG